MLSLIVIAAIAVGGLYLVKKAEKAKTPPAPTPPDSPPTAHPNDGASPAPAGPSAPLDFFAAAAVEAHRAAEQQRLAAVAENLKQLAILQLTPIASHVASDPKPHPASLVGQDPPKAS